MNIEVTSTADSGEGSLRDAVEKALNGDIVTFAIPSSDAGYDAESGKWTILLTSGEIEVSCQNLKFQGGGKIILDSGKKSRIFNHCGEGSLTLEGMTFRNGKTRNGFIVTDGGVLQTNGSVIATGCAFLSNMSTGCGGAIWALGSIAAVNCELPPTSQPAAEARCTQKKASLQRVANSL